METKENITTEETAIEENKKNKKKEIFRAIKFVLFSASAGIVQAVSFTILSELIFHDTDNEYGWSYFIALTLSVIWNFTFNRKFTFKSAKNVPVAMLLTIAYYLVFTPLSIWWGIALVNKAGWNKYLVLFITMFINLVTEFLWQRYVIYNKNVDTLPKKKKEENK